MMAAYLRDRALHRQYRGCERKKRYPTKAAATRAAGIHRRHGSVKLTPYECTEFCGGWHLTKKGWQT